MKGTSEAAGFLGRLCPLLAVIVDASLAPAAGGDAACEVNAHSTSAMTTRAGLSLLQAASSTKKMAAAQLSDEDLRPSSAAVHTPEEPLAPRAPPVAVASVAQMAAGARLAATARRASGAKAREAVRIDWADVAAFASNYKALIFALGLLIVLSVITYFFFLRPKKFAEGDELGNRCDSNKGVKFADADQDQTTAEDTDATQTQFCPELVVPEGSKCVLVLPTAAIVKDVCDVLDLSGNIMLQATPQPGKDWHVVMKTRAGDTVAQCRRVDRGGATPEYHVFGKEGRPSAKLKREWEDVARSQFSYTLSLSTGGSLRFWGNLCELNIINETGTMVAFSETHEPSPTSAATPAGQHLRLHVNQFGDAALALCGALCISQCTATDATGMSASTSRRPVSEAPASGQCTAADATGMSASTSTRPVLWSLHDAIRWSASAERK